MFLGDGTTGLSSLYFKSRLNILQVFWINLPTGGFAIAILFIFLNLNPHKGRALRDHAADADFIGLFSIVAGVVCLLLGFNFSESSCEFSLDPVYSGTLVLIQIQGSTPQTIALLTVGAVTLLGAGLNEAYTKKYAIIPPRLFRVRFSIHSFGLVIERYWADPDHDDHPHHLLPPRHSILLSLILLAYILPVARVKCDRRRHSVLSVFGPAR